MVLTACSGDPRAPGDLEEAMRAAYLHSDTETPACFPVLIFAQALKTYVRADQLLGSQH